MALPAAPKWPNCHSLPVRCKPSRIPVIPIVMCSILSTWKWIRLLLSVRHLPTLGLPPPITTPIIIQPRHCLMWKKHGVRSSKLHLQGLAMWTIMLSRATQRSPLWSLTTISSQLLPSIWRLRTRWAWDSYKPKLLLMPAFFFLIYSTSKSSIEWSELSRRWNFPSSLITRKRRSPKRNTKRFCVKQCLRFVWFNESLIPPVYSLIITFAPRVCLADLSQQNWRNQSY